MRPSVLFEMQPNKDNSAFAASLVILTAEHEILPSLLHGGDYPRWITIEIHHYSSRGHFLTEVLSRDGYTLKGGEDKSVSDVNVCASRNPP